MYATSTVDTIIGNMANGNRQFAQMIRNRARVRPIPSEFSESEIPYNDLPGHGGKHNHRRKSMSKFKSTKRRRTRRRMRKYN